MEWDWVLWQIICLKSSAGGYAPFEPTAFRRCPEHGL